MTAKFKKGTCNECAAEGVRVRLSSGWVSPRHPNGCNLCVFCANDTHLGSRDWDRRLSLLMHALLAELRRGKR